MQASHRCSSTKLKEFWFYFLQLFFIEAHASKNLRKFESRREQHHLRRKRGPRVKLEDTDARKLDRGTLIYLTVVGYAHPTLVESAVRGTA